MAALMAALQFLVGATFRALALLFVLRFLLYAVRAEFHNPVSQFVYRLSNPVVSPLRRIIPNVGGFEIASLLVILAIEALAITALAALEGARLAPNDIVLGAVVGTLVSIIGFLCVVLIVNALLSWVPNAGGHPGARLLNQISVPVLKPIRSFVPLIQGFDLSPLIAIIALQTILVALSQIA
ncbi:MAG: YggT family protein [Pseudomonadota bacterium]